MNYHRDEKLNGRSVYLRMLGQIWVVPVCGVIAALVFGLIYTAYLNINSQKRSYLVTAKYYINFAFNEDTQKAYDYYNAATWNDLIFSDPAISDSIKAGLPEGMTMQEAREDTLALVISDIRLLTVEVRTPSPEQSTELSKAVMDGLVSFGNTAKEFENIEYLSMEEPALEIIRDRTRNAVLLGLLLGLLASYFVLLLRTVMDDAIYTPEEAVSRYGLPVIAVMGRSRKSAAAAAAVKQTANKADGNTCGKTDNREDSIAGMPDFLADETLRAVKAFAGCAEDAAGTAVISPYSKEDAQEAVKELSALGKDDFDESMQPITAVKGPAGEEYEEAAANGKRCIVAVRFGKGRGARVENLINDLKNRGAVIEGIVIFGADPGFLRRYYGD